MALAARLASGVAHDLNNILIVIKGYAEVAQGSGVQDPTLLEQLRKISAAAERAVQLTHQLSLFGRGQVATGLTVEADRLVLRSLAQARDVLRRGAAVDVVLGAPQATVRVDGAMLAEALRALLVWGVDGRPSATELSLQTWWEPREGDTAGAGRFHIEFCDAGPDIEPRHYPHLFEPFYGSKELRRGSGLGLAVVHGVARQHQARLLAEPRAEGGTRVTLSFEATAAAGEGTASRLPGRAGTLAGGTESVCLVTADARLREWAEPALRDLGYRVACAGSAVEGAVLWEKRSGRFDVVIEDQETVGGAGPVAWLPPRAPGEGLRRAVVLLGPRFRLLSPDAFPDTDVSLIGRASGVASLARAVRAQLDRRRAGADPGAAE